MSEVGNKRKLAAADTIEAESSALTPHRSARTRATRKDIVASLELEPSRKRARKHRGEAANGAKGKATKRSYFFEIPLDVVLEILSNCHPYTLLNLARASKSLRAMIMSRSAKRIWESALRALEPPLPPCPDSMAEPRYVNLIFDHHCHNCLKRNTQKVDFVLEVRYCHDCYKECLVSRRDALYKSYWEFMDIHITPFRRWKLSGSTQYTTRAQLKAVRAQLNMLPRSRWSEFSSEQERLLSARENHAVECEEWVKAAQVKAAAARAEAAAARLSESEIQERKLARRLAIFNKLTKLGYGDVLEAMGTNSFSTHPPLSDHPLINSVQTLWGKEWKKIEPDIVSHMREMRDQLMN